MRGACQWKLSPSVTADNTGILKRNQRETQQNHGSVVLKKHEKKKITNKGCQSLLGDTNAYVRYFRHE